MLWYVVCGLLEVFGTQAFHAREHQQYRGHQHLPYSDSSPSSYIFRKDGYLPEITVRIGGHTTKNNFEENPSPVNDKFRVVSPLEYARQSLQDSRRGPLAQGHRYPVAVPAYYQTAVHPAPPYSSSHSKEAQPSGVRGSSSEVDEEADVSEYDNDDERYPRSQEDSDVTPLEDNRNYVNNQFDDKQDGGSVENDHKHHQSHSKAGGSSHGSEHETSHGGKEDSGHKSHHDFSKGSKGQNNKEESNGYYSGAEGHKGGYDKGGQKSGANHKGQTDEKGGSYGNDGHHKKGHKTTGYHKVYDKDEFKKDRKFYDDSHLGGQSQKYGDNHEHHGTKHEDQEKGSHHESGYKEGQNSKEDHYKKDQHHSKANGHKGNSGHESGFKHSSSYEQKDGKQHHKSYKHT